MTGRYVRVLFGVLTLLALASPSHAARRSSLSGNLLIQDVDDVFFFPHLVTTHKRMVTYDYGTAANLGSGGMVFGSEKLTIGAFTHRSDFLTAIRNAYFTNGDIDNLGRAGSVPRVPIQLDATTSVSAFNWVDGLVGWQMGENPWGLRFSLGHDTNDPSAANVKRDATAFGVVVGTRLAKYKTDASIEFSYTSASDEIGGPGARKLEESPFTLALAARRTATEDSDALVLGWLGMFDYTSGTVDRTAGTT